MHFKPRYDPWDQRLCFVPDGDLFRALRSGQASIVTDTIETFTPAGIRLASGRELDADVIVTATGLQLLPFGGMDLVVDGEPVDYSQTMAYKALMLSGVPNFVYTVGYTNASWTLKADLVSTYVVPAARGTWTGSAPGRWCRSGSRRSARSRSWTSSPATCSGRSTGCPSRATGRRGG